MNDLDSLEKKIDLTVLKWYNREDYRAKQERFRQTVMAAHTIVSQKLYKTKSQTVESYFRDVWKISRASVYRFLDCALVLEQLKDFPDWSKPSHERLCRSLKKLTKNPVHMRYLWKKVLLKAGDNPNLITSTFIKKVWQELITSGEMPNVDENDENNLFKKKKGTSKNSKLESSNSNSKLKKKINNDQSLLQYNGNNNSYNNDNNNMKSNQDVSNQCDSNNNSQYNLSLSSSLSSSQTFKIESTDHSPSFSELNIQQNMNNTISVPSNDNWIHDSSQSIINPNLSCSSNSSSSCSSTYGMNDNEQNHSHSIGDSLENYNKYRILSPPLSTASSYSNLPFHKQINIKENELISSINLQNKNNRNEKCININNNNNNNNNININNNNNNYNNNSNNNYNNNNINNNNNNYNNNNNNNNNNAFIIDQYVYCLASSNNTKIKSNENNNYNYTNINCITNQQNLNSNSNISSYKTINSFNKNNNISNNELCQNQYTKNTENNINQSMTLTETMNENSSSKEIKPAWSLSMEIFNNSNYNNNNNKNSNSNKNNTDDFNQNHIESKNISSSILNIENLL